ncbi:hypothetical protein [Burkholderia ambifaria]|uniref:hypothetical protein n=1 Tax=Burkholderia ambifaria TaxID=152480 RepID=UPI000F8142B5|nr:hypothetical protein [Burkholderia ambifaria]
MSSNQTLKLSRDKNAVALRQIRQIREAVGTIFGIIQDGTAINAELATNCVKVAEFELAYLCKTLGIETDSAQERDQRYVQLRQANERIRELEAQLGNVQAPEVTQMSLKQMAEQLRRWWRHEGFGHISDIAFGEYVCKVNFSCNMFGDFRLVDSDTPVTDKERKGCWYDSLRERGFVLIEDDREWALADCDASRHALCELFKSRLPSSKVFKFDNVQRHRVDGFVIRSAEVYIHQISDILTLPVPEKKAV